MGSVSSTWQHGNLLEMQIPAGPLLWRMGSGDACYQVVRTLHVGCLEKNVSLYLVVGVVDVHMTYIMFRLQFESFEYKERLYNLLCDCIARPCE